MDTSYFACDWADDVAPLHSLHKDMPPYIVVNLNKNGERFLSELMQDVQTYLNKGYMVYFVPVAKGHNTYYNDEQYFTLLRKGVNSEATGKDEQSFQLLDREYDFQTFLHILKGAELVISTRLHLFLIASFLNVPTKVYPYQRKILKMQEVMKKFAKKD
jgi:polysaccharide pyruvyl transferase WcaK-like protein